VGRLPSFVAAVLLSACAVDVGDPVEGRAAALREPSAVEVDFVRILNDYRAENGAPAVQFDLALNEGAHDYALVLAGGHWSHTGPDGSSFDQRMCEAGYEPACGPTTLVGEHLAA